MAAIVLFGATGYTGRLTTEALARRGLDFAVAGRDRTKLEALARENGDPEIILGEANDVDSLTRALNGARVLITCVGPFLELGWAAAEAALRAGVHYIDSAGESVFIHELAERYDQPARTSEIVMAPAMGFDEVPSDVAVSMAVKGLGRPEVVVTYAVPTTASAGTVRTTLGVLTSPGWRVSGGHLVEMRIGDRERWAPLPAPLGVRRSVSAPLAIGRVAPMHLQLQSLDVFMTVGEVQRLGVKAGMPLLRYALSTEGGRAIAHAVVQRLPEGPGNRGRGKYWTVMAEARAGDRWRNVVLTGKDLYGLTGDLLASAAAQLLEDSNGRGVLAPVQARGLQRLQRDLKECGVSIDSYGVDGGPRGD